MARRPHEEYTKVVWCTTIADKDAPTVTELNAGVELSTYIAVDGVNAVPETQVIASKAITDRYDAEIPGSYSGTPELKMFRDDEDDDAYELCVLDTVGYLVIRRMVRWDVAWTAGQQVEVWPSTMGLPGHGAGAANENTTFMEKFPGRESPSLQAEVAAA